MMLETLSSEALAMASNAASERRLLLPLPTLTHREKGRLVLPPFHLNDSFVFLDLNDWLQLICDSNDQGLKYHTLTFLFC